MVQLMWARKGDDWCACRMDVGVIVGVGYSIYTVRYVERAWNVMILRSTMNVYGSIYIHNTVSDVCTYVNLASICVILHLAAADCFSQLHRKINQYRRTVHTQKNRIRQLVDEIDHTSPCFLHF